jgi:hypothetical protein
MATSEKKTSAKCYVAVRGIDFPIVRVEPGDRIPEGVKQDVIDDLLAHGDIKETK